MFRMIDYKAACGWMISFVLGVFPNPDVIDLSTKIIVMLKEFSSFLSFIVLVGYTLHKWRKSRNTKKYKED